MPGRFLSPIKSVHEASQLPCWPFGWAGPKWVNSGSLQFSTKRTTNEESKNEDTKKEVSSAIEEVTGDLNIKEEVENISKPLKKIVVSDKIENKDIISEIMDEVKSKVVENTNSKNITLEIVEN